MKPTLSRCGLVGLLFISAWSSQAQVLIFKDGMEPLFGVPASDAEAARFLTQASFGPTRAGITALRSQYLDQWLDQQIALPPTLARPHLDTLSANGVSVSQNQRLDRWFHTVALAPDQLRQRMAFALSQILVISDRADTLSGDTFGVAEYWDILARNAFGNYRQLLQEVTLSPQMGRYLSHWRNRKANPDGSIQPDENYAREIMQLFTVGLVERNLDFSPVLAGLDPIPTYDQDVITDTAKVFTGWSYTCNGAANCNTYTGLNSGAASFLPMACFPAYMDGSQKLLIGGTAISASPDICGNTNGAGTSNTIEPTDAALKQRCRDYCSSQIDQFLDILFAHPNTAPFVSRQLIQRFVTSNPSPAYIQRVASVFEDDGSPAQVRGNLGAVIRAVLMDAEARLAPSDPAAAYGKLREPLLRLTAIWRAFGVTAPTVAADGQIPMGQRSPEVPYAQRPLGAPTVFNFYEPDYKQPGALEASSLFAPEFQITNESTVLTGANDTWSKTWNGYSTSTGAFAASNPTTAAWLNVADLAALAAATNSPAGRTALIEELNLRMIYGSLRAETKTALSNLLEFGMFDASANQKTLGLIHLLSLSPDFAIQR